MADDILSWKAKTSKLRGEIDVLMTSGLVDGNETSHESFLAASRLIDDSLSTSIQSTSGQQSTQRKWDGPNPKGAYQSKRGGKSSPNPSYIKNRNKSVQEEFEKNFHAKFADYVLRMGDFRLNRFVKNEDMPHELFEKIADYVWENNLVSVEDVVPVTENFKRRTNYYKGCVGSEATVMTKMFWDLSSNTKSLIVRQDMMFLFGEIRSPEDQEDIEKEYMQMVLSLKSKPK